MTACGISTTLLLLGLVMMGCAHDTFFTVTGATDWAGMVFEKHESACLRPLSLISIENKRTSRHCEKTIEGSGKKSDPDAKGDLPRGRAIPPIRPFPCGSA